MKDTQLDLWLAMMARLDGLRIDLPGCPDIGNPPRASLIRKVISDGQPLSSHELVFEKTDAAFSYLLWLNSGVISVSPFRGSGKVPPETVYSELGLAVLCDDDQGKEKYQFFDVVFQIPPGDDWLASFARCGFPVVSSGGDWARVHLEGGKSAIVAKVPDEMRIMDGWGMGAARLEKSGFHPLGRPRAIKKLQEALRGMQYRILQ